MTPQPDPRTAECLLPAVGASVPQARALVRRELDRWGIPSLIDDCALIVSELVTNAVRHGGTALALRLVGGAGWVYGEIYDPGDGVPRMRESGADATSGRGLMIVAALADDWGVTRPQRGGKIVWFVAGDGASSGRATLGADCLASVC
ncbi:ATP-binding protein [Planotetraspora phitsanulokensis]|uniref:ATP-binding protein n=1 Tax=Planotetraspora phitsanulokensis TaxID=575192 RepID=A0A8J3U4B6_9ACTN|nr:ATP-binding protein [Planotetraspora phitsanulokensis]GII37712.1 ATP-binding protein [Planotetraspora phitsanulokensis]